MIPVLVALIATSCGGGDDDDADEPTDRPRSARSEPTATDAEEPTAEETGPEEPERPLRSGRRGHVRRRPGRRDARRPRPCPSRCRAARSATGSRPTSTASTPPRRRCRPRPDDGERGVRHARPRSPPDNQVVPYLAESFTPSDDFKSLDDEAAPGHHVPRRRRRSTPTRSSSTSRPSAATRWWAWRSSRSSPRPAPSTKIDDLTVQFNLLDSNAYFPATLATQLGMVGLADVARRRARRPGPQPAAGRHRAVQVRHPQPGLGHPLRAQRRLVGRRGLPRRGRVLPGARLGDPCRPACWAASSKRCRPPTPTSILMLEDEGIAANVSTTRPPSSSR